MPVTDLYATEIGFELLKVIAKKCIKSASSRQAAERMLDEINCILPTLREMQYSGLELTPTCQYQIESAVETLKEGMELVTKIFYTSRWNVRRHVHFAGKLAKLKMSVAELTDGQMQILMLRNLHQAIIGVDKLDERVNIGVERLNERVDKLCLAVGRLNMGVERLDVGIDRLYERVERLDERVKMQWRLQRDARRTDFAIYICIIIFVQMVILYLQRFL